MPNDDQFSFQACLSALEELQNELEDAEFSTAYKNHLNLLQTLNTVLSNKVEVSPSDADRVLTLCLRYTTDVRCVLYVFPIISELIDIVKDNPHVDFLPFALAILEFLNAKCHVDGTSQLRILSFQVLIKHPKSTWVRLIRVHSSKVITTFQLLIRLHKYEDLISELELFKLLAMLKWLPQYEKSLLVQAGLKFWFSDIIPSIMMIVGSDGDVDKIEECLTHTELLAEELVLLNYYQLPCWKSLMLSIANARAYPETIMRLLERGKDNWHRVWIMLIKISKYELTRNCPLFASPINSMLPIVESAFKKDPAQRIRAFACWDALIERFYNEGGRLTEKKIKLLIIPLKLHNSKTKETAEAKFQTWWNFIQKFRPMIQNYTDDILISFLHFMFGSGTRPQAASQLSDCLRKKCIDAFAEIIHDNGSNCAMTNMNQLDGNITTTVMLTDHWKDFMYALKSCIRAVAKSYTMDTKSKIQSIWISFVMRLASMAEDILRNNMFDDLINILSELIMEDEMRGNEALMELIVDDITLPLWRDNKLGTLTVSRSQSHRPMHRVVKLIMDDVFNNYFKRFNREELNRLLQPLISILLEESIATPEYIIWLLEELPVTNSTLVMWTALAQASKESALSPEACNKILLWPFKTGHISFEVKEAAATWYSLYNIINENLKQTDFDSKISKVLTRPVENSKASNYFVLYALIGVLKHKPDEEKMAKLEALTYEMNDYNDLGQLFIPLVDTIQLMINHSTDENLAQITINCVKNILKGIRSKSEAIGSRSPIQDRENTSSNLRAGSDTITSTLKTYFEKCPYQSIKQQVRSLFPEWDIPPKEFASPKIQELEKSKNKKARIETTVVENGEEYVVVKSNWKFNPKKLTENQKEKLQRKRDIPALYQDLSQSQDEFRLTSWKTDSQDTSLSSTKSATSNDAANTLSKITNPDIVPKIMENICGIETNSKPKTGANVSPVAKVKTPKADKLSTPGVIKSPRVALKDRIYRNVRNLIRNSSSSQDEVTVKQEGNIFQNVSDSPLSKPELVSIERATKHAESIEKKNRLSNDDVITTNKQENGSLATSPPNDRRKLVVYTPRIDEIMNRARTPVSKAQKDINFKLSTLQTPVDTPVSKAEKDISLTSSAPQTSADRPSRLKRTPKKFDNSLMLGVKKKQCSKYCSQDLLGRTETTMTQIHNSIGKMDDISTQKVSPIKAGTNETVNKSPTATGDIIVENVMSCVAADDKSPKDDEKARLISLKTSTNKPTSRSPEKPSTGKNPSNLSQTSEGVNNDAPQKETYHGKQNVQTTDLLTLNKPKKLQKVGAQLNKITSHKKIKYSKNEDQNEISSFDENTAVNTPVIADTDLNQTKISAKESVLLNDADKNTEKEENISTPTNKTKNDSDTSLPVSTPQEPQNTPKKVATLHEVITDNMDTPNISRRKFRKSKVQKQISDGELRKSRIEKSLAIDMVEGHPYLKTETSRRLTRTKVIEVKIKRKTVIEKLNKSKLKTPKTYKKNKKCSPSVNSTIIVEDSQDKAQNVSPQNVLDEPPCSEDVIESSQDSTMTTICVKAKKLTPTCLSVEAIQKITLPITLTQNLIQDSTILDKPDEENHDRSDIELPQNKSIESDKNVMDLTENMDTEPIGDLINTTDLTENMNTEAANETVGVIVMLSETLPTPVTVNSDSEIVTGLETQELAEADTQPNDPKQFEKWGQFEIHNSNPPESLTIEDINTENDTTQRLPEAALVLANMDDTTEVSSPCKDDNQRKQDFLNNTVEISPIKVQSPDRRKKSPSPETSTDFVVIQLSSPVHSNGEPFEKLCSPECFSEDKASSGKQNGSPPRVEVTVKNASPSPSLSLKKNRPTSGRAAQMLGLLSISNIDIKQLPAKPGLRFNNNTKIDSTVEQNPSMDANFLELQRPLPTDTCSPSSILKRKHIDIMDDSITSPAKRKRVSFHDPPVSTSVAVLKYIEPISVMRSPQSSSMNRQTRSGLKSPKKLDNAFLASALFKTIESFTEAITPSDETENISLDVTPAVEIVNTSELNDADPICPDLIDCTDPIDVIAIELSSAAMRDLFIKELEGKVDTVGDLAKMTELEVNRLSIKAPKITVAKKVLTDYIANRPAFAVETAIEEAFSEPMTESLHVTNTDAETQTDGIEPSTESTQVTVAKVTSEQTTEDIIDSFISSISEREDLFEKFKEKLSDDQVQSIARLLSTKQLIRLILQKPDESPTTLVKRALKYECKDIPKSSKHSSELTFFKKLFLERYGIKDLLKFSSEILYSLSASASAVRPRSGAPQLHEDAD